MFNLFLRMDSMDMGLGGQGDDSLVDSWGRTGRHGML